MIDRSLTIFRTAATVLNFTEAAALLGMTQPNVTQQLAKLERELGATLFFRNGRSVELTPAGRVLLAECARLFAAEESILRKIRSAKRGRRSFTLGGTVTAGSFLLLGMKTLFQRENPDCDLRLAIDRQETLLPRLIAGEIDLLLTEDPYDAKYFLAEPYHTDRLVPVFAPGYLREERFSLGEYLRSGGAVVTGEFGSGSRLAFRRFLNGHRLPEPEPPQLIEVNSLDAAKQLAQSGLGIALLSELAVENEYKAGVLRQGGFTEGEVTRPVDFIYLASGDQQFIAEFVRFCRLRKGLSLTRPVPSPR